MINPDMENILLISESDFKHFEIENVTKLRTENKALKSTIALVLLLSVVLVITNYYNSSDRRRDSIE
jgi:hypothetical protein